MGSFPGHAIPGTFFSLFGLWWMSQLPRRRLMCEQKNIAYFNTVTFPVPFERLSRLPVEGMVKMAFCTIGMACELYASMDYGDAGFIKSKTDMQHFTMYTFFMLSGLMDCFTYSGWKTFTNGLDYIVMTLAFVGEWVLFTYHLEEGEQMGQLHVHVHILLLYVIAACAFVTALELRCTEYEIVAFLRSYFTLLQGTWFYQIGFILYPPSSKVKQWDDTPSDRTIATTAFTWHMICDLVIITLLYLFASCTYKKHCRIFEFNIEHQIKSNGWTLKRLRQKLSRNVQYSKLATNDEENSLIEHVEANNKCSDMSDVEL